MTVYLLPAPRFDWLLPASRPEQPPRLSTAARTLLLNAARQRQETDLEWWPLHSAYQAVADELLLAGLLRHHPDAKKRTWYGLTAAGMQAAAALRRDAIAERQLRLLDARHERYERIARDLRDAGYFVLPEPGRGWETGEVAFYRPTDGRRLLLTCRLGSTDWREYDRHYYQPIEADDEPAQRARRATAVTCSVADILAEMPI